MLPKRFYERMKDMLGDRFELFLESYNSVPYRALRVNTLKANAELVTSKLPFLTKKTPFGAPSVRKVPQGGSCISV